MSGEIACFKSARVSGEVQAVGAMLGPAWFDIGRDREVQPFAISPWSDEPETWADLPPLMHRLRGDWACVPFGMPDNRRDLPPRWLDGLGDPRPALDPFPHGFGSNHPWTLTESRSGVDGAIGYPPSHPIRWIERSVHGDAMEAAIDLTLTVHPRRDVELPVGLHPTFRLPDDVGAARLVLAPGVKAWSLPVETEPGKSHLRPDSGPVDPTRLPSTGSGLIDITRLPLVPPSEDLVLLTGTGGKVALDNPAEGYRVTLEWDATVLPSCLIWLSNFGRAFSPWNGRFRAIGIEPICSNFDFGTEHATNRRNPLAQAGIATAIAFKAGKRWSTQYRISCSAI